MKNFKEELIALSKLVDGDKKNVFIVTHKNPDGDAIGSSLGLKGYLESLGHNVTSVIPNEFPAFLNWMEGSDEILDYTLEKEKVEQALTDAELIFCLDFNTLSRIDELGDLIAESNAKKVMIDHHQQPDDFPDVTFSDVDCCSTCQLVYEIVEAMGAADSVNAKAASALYTGIMTDTGSFKFPSTTSETHRIISKLIEAGADNADIHSKVHDNQSLDRLQLLGHCLHSMEVFPEYKAALIKVSKEDHYKYNIQKGDTEGMVNFPLSVKGINFSAFMREDKDLVKISFRSKGDFSVNEFSRSHFGGGGHNNAAGGASEDSLEATVEKFKSLLPQYKDALDY